MARYYEYKCKSCGYTVYANPKGEDMVMMGELYSYHCMECNEIVDVSCGHGENLRKSAQSVALEILRSGTPELGNVPSVGRKWRKQIW